MTHAVALGGVALHAGVNTSVLFALHDGPLVLEQHGELVALADLVVSRTDGGVTVGSPSGGLRVDLVEHVLAALGGLGVHAGVRMVINGPEPPLLDGGARAFAAALRRLGAGPQQRAARVTREASVELGRSRYLFSPSQRVSVEVDIEFDHALVQASHAHWDGTPEDFEARIASARTFGFLSDWEALKAVGRARGANARDVVVLCDGGTTMSEPGPAPDECARHKLLDLVGDMTLSGGVPLGRIHALRPGHAANLAALQQARASGIVAPG